MKKIQVWLVTILMAAGLGLLAPAPAAATTSYCGLTWGSLAKTDPAVSQSQLVNVRTGRHYCFDRLVIDLNAAATGYNVVYVPKVTQDGSGHTVPLRGRAFLQVTVRAPAYDEQGNATYAPANKNELSNVDGYQTFRQVAWAGSFEGQSSLGLGVRSRLPFRVFSLDGPGAGSRLVIDVAHFW